MVLCQPTYPLSLKYARSEILVKLQNHPKKMNFFYETSQRFQDTWTIQFPLVKMLQGNDREVQHVKCIVCGVVWRRDMIPSVKLDILKNNVGKQNVIKHFATYWGEKRWNVCEQTMLACLKWCNLCKHASHDHHWKSASHA